MDYNVDHPNPDEKKDQNVPTTPLVPPDHRRRGVHKRLILIAAGVIVIALAVTALFIFIGKEDTSTDQQSQQQTPSEEDEAPALSPTEAAQPETYNSETLKIEFVHRRDWTVTEDADAKRIIVTSPEFTYKTADGESTSDVFTLVLGMGASEGAKTTINAAKAVKDSEVIAYDAPTEQQRFYTNVSYAGPEDATFTFFIVTGSNALKTGNSLTGNVSLFDSDLLIAGGFGEDSERLDFDRIALADVGQNTALDQALAIVKSLKVY